MFIEDDGIPLSLVLEKPESPDPCPLVILLHGFGSAKERLHNVRAAEAMRSAGFATIRMDLYGHGESGGEFRRHTLWKWISNVMTVIAYAGSLDFVTEIFLSGHSQGGLVAALAAGMEPDRIRGLVLRAPAFLIPEGARSGSLLGYTFDPDRIPDSIPLPQGVTLDGDYIRVAQAVHAEEAADRFKGPVLILQGDQDDLVPPESVREIAGRYADCSLEILPGETHHFDRDPDRMYRIILEWMQKQHR